MRKIPIAVLALAALAAAGSASAQTREVQKEHLDRYLKYVQPPVDQFQFWSLYKYELVGPEKVVVWPNVREAYLLTVAKPCPGLEWAHGIGVTSKQGHYVSRKFDYVTYGKGQCEITEIQPIDYPKMLKDGRQPEGAAKAE